MGARVHSVLTGVHGRAPPTLDTPEEIRGINSRTELADVGVAAVGISPDKPGAQKKFDEKFGLEFPLLSDTEHAAAKAYGAWGEKSMYGKKSMGIIRSSFLIDENGKIMGTWYKVKPEDTVPLAKEALSK